MSNETLSVIAAVCIAMTNSTPDQSVYHTNVMSESQNSTLLSSGTILVYDSLVWRPAHDITFSAGDGEITICTTNGRVTLSDGLTLDEASRVFWEVVQAAWPEMFIEKTPTEAQQ